MRVSCARRACVVAGPGAAPARCHACVGREHRLRPHLKVTGTVAPAEPALAVTIEQQRGGFWTAVATTTTSAAGAYATSFGATTGGPLRARLDDGTLSPEHALKVRPAVSLSFGRARAFLGTTWQARFNRPPTRRGCGSRCAPRGGFSHVRPPVCSRATSRSAFRLPGRAGCASSSPCRPRTDL
jgi:hypothetical protein